MPDVGFFDLWKSVSNFQETLPMDRQILQQRTMQFHINVIRLCGALPGNAAGFKLPGS
jgi:hypothetical protein